MDLERIEEVFALNDVDKSNYLDEYEIKTALVQLNAPIPEYYEEIVRLVDYDFNGLMDLDEFKQFYKVLTVGDDPLSILFAAADRDGDGKLSIDELIEFISNLGYKAEKSSFRKFGESFAKDGFLGRSEFEQAVVWLCCE